jgi:hypothetical protein
MQLPTYAQCIIRFSLNIHRLFRSNRFVRVHHVYRLIQNQTLISCAQTCPGRAYTTIQLTFRTTRQLGQLLSNCQEAFRVASCSSTGGLRLGKH